MDRAILIRPVAGLFFAEIAMLLVILHALPTGLNIKLF
jgi:hypothetical protein